MWALVYSKAPGEASSFLPDSPTRRENTCEKFCGLEVCQAATFSLCGTFGESVDISVFHGSVGFTDAIVILSRSSSVVGGFNRSCHNFEVDIGEFGNPACECLLHYMVCFGNISMCMWRLRPDCKDIKFIVVQHGWSVRLNLMVRKRVVFPRFSFTKEIRL